jgi:hypothetical protein
MFIFKNNPKLKKIDFFLTKVTFSNYQKHVWGMFVFEYLFFLESKEQELKNLRVKYSEFFQKYSFNFIFHLLTHIGGEFFSKNFP